MTKDIETGTMMRSATAIGIVVCAAALSFSGSGFAQNVEQNPARILAGNQITSLPGATVEAGELDGTSLGVSLKGIVIVSDNSAVRNAVSSTGVVVHSDNALLTDPELATLLAPFVGQPLSQRLIGEVRDAITNYMRDNNRPLVAVIIPPQEVTSGSVQLLVVPFVVGDKRVERVATGHQTTSEDYVLEQVRLGRGDEIAADLLLADINWLNLNPFRSVGVVFQPGSEAGSTDVVLRLTDEKPWQIYAGYSNGGTEATGYDRLFKGIVFAAGEHQFSYQVTAAPGTIYSDGKLFNFDADSAYLAHSGGYFVPLPWRHKLTLRGDYIHSRADLTDPFVQDNETIQFALDYAVPVSAAPAIDVFAGLEIKNQRNEVFFGGTSTKDTTLDVVQSVFGARGVVSTTGHTTGFDVRAVLSPGGLTGNNNDTAFIAASGDTNAKAQYGYAKVDLNHHSDLPYDFGLDLNLAGQLASSTLPAIEQFGIGGMDAVRGYQSGEAVGDSGFKVQAELHLPTFSLLQKANLQDQISVYAFADYGLTHIYSTGASQSLFGAGLGVDMSINDNVHATLAWGHAFAAGPTTLANSNRIHASLVASY